MITVLLSVLVFLLAMLGLACGIMFGKHRLKGSCGGCALCLYKRGGS